MRFLRISFRVGVAAVGVFVTLLMVYAIVVNALLFSGVGRAAINWAAPKHIRVDWRTAYSPWFLRVHTTGFVIRGEDSTVQWIVTTERANGSFRLVDFFARRIRLHHTWAQGVTAAIHLEDTPAGPPIADEKYRLVESRSMTSRAMTFVRSRSTQSA